MRPIIILPCLLTCLLITTCVIFAQQPCWPCGQCCPVPERGSIIVPQSCYRIIPAVLPEAERQLVCATEDDSDNVSGIVQTPLFAVVQQVLRQPGAVAYMHVGADAAVVTVDRGEYVVLYDLHAVHPCVVRVSAANDNERVSGPPGESSGDTGQTTVTVSVRGKPWVPFIGRVMLRRIAIRILNRLMGV